MLNECIKNTNSYKNLMNDNAKGKFPHAVMLISEDTVYAEKYAECLAKLLLCESKVNDDMCGVCTICQNIEKSVHPDVLRFGKDGVISADDASEIVGSVVIGPYSAERKIYILYNYDKINKTVENKLLKTLEEPPSYCTFILVVGNINRLLQTTLSRTRKIYLEGLSISQLSQILESQRVQEPEIIAVQACGSLEKAQGYANSNDAKAIMDFVCNCLTDMNDTMSIVNFAFKFEEFSNHFDDVVNSFALVTFDALKTKIGANELVENKHYFSAIKTIADNTSVTALTKIIEATYKAKKMRESNVVMSNIIDQFLLKIVEVKIKCRKR